MKHFFLPAYEEIDIVEVLSCVADPDSPDPTNSMVISKICGRLEEIIQLRANEIYFSLPAKDTVLDDFISDDIVELYVTYIRSFVPTAVIISVKVCKITNDIHLTVEDI